MRFRDLFYQDYAANRCETRERFTFQPLISEIKYFFRKRKKLRDCRSSLLSSNSLVFKSISSFDEQIRDKGAIVDNMGNKHTTAQSYKNYLKENNLVIRDWSPGSNAGSRQFKGCDINDIPNF